MLQIRKNINYYIPPEDRIAVFDNDGTLWSEKPIPFQGYFSIDRVPAVVAKNPELKEHITFQRNSGKELYCIKRYDRKRGNGSDCYNAFKYIRN